MVAYDHDDRGSVSVSFGPLAVTRAHTWTKTVTLDNTGSRAATYDLSYRPLTSVPGTLFRVSPRRVTVPAAGRRPVRVSFVVRSVARMTKRIDYTTRRTTPDGEVPLDTMSETSGLLLATPRGSAPQLRVPLYAAPRPASTLESAGQLAVSTGTDQVGRLLESGRSLGAPGHNGVGNSDPYDDISSWRPASSSARPVVRSRAARAPTSRTATALPEERAGDLRYVGITSDASYRSSAQRGYIAIVTRAPHSIPASKITFRVDLDVNDDGIVDAYLINTRVPGEDVFEAQLLDARTQTVIGEEPLDARQGNIDAAVFDSDAMILPFSLKLLARYGLTGDHPRIRYGVESWSAYSPNRLDEVGVSSTGALGLTADLGTPGIIVRDRDGRGPLVGDRSGRGLVVHRDLPAFEADHGHGLLLLHLHDVPGQQAQVIRLGYAAAVRLQVRPARVRRGAPLRLRVSVAGRPGLPAPTGRVRVVDTVTGATLVRGRLRGGQGDAGLSHRSAHHGSGAGVLHRGRDVRRRRAPPRAACGSCGSPRR